VLSQNWEKRLLVSSRLSVRPSFRLYGTTPAFPERILKKFLMSIFRKSVVKIQVSLQPDKSNE
jgi:hypothetical protein